MEVDFETGSEEAVELGKVGLFLFVAGRVNANIALEFTSLSVDGSPVFPIIHSNLPNGQGVSVRVGTFEQGKQVPIAWKFHTHIITQPIDVAIGVLRNPGSARTILEKRTIDAFKDYGGTAVVTA